QSSLCEKSETYLQLLCHALCIIQEDVHVRTMTLQQMFQRIYLDLLHLGTTPNLLHRLVTAGFLVLALHIQTRLLLLDLYDIQFQPALDHHLGLYQLSLVELANEERESYQRLSLVIIDNVSL